MNLNFDEDGKFNARLNTLSAKMQFCFFCALYYGAIAFGVVFFRNFDSDVIVALY